MPDPKTIIVVDDHEYELVPSDNPDVKPLTDLWNGWEKGFPVWSSA